MLDIYHQATLLVVTLVTAYYFYVIKRRKLPPGPLLRLPILGHLPFLGGNPSLKLLQWSKIYGPILYVHLGSNRAIVIHDRQLIRKAFNLNSFAGRPHNKLLDTISGNRRGKVVIHYESFAFTDGPIALEQRKFIQRLLKDFGYVTNSMESRLLDHVKTLLDIFEDHLTKPLTVKHTFNRNILNALWAIVVGETIVKNDKTFQQLAVNVSNLAEMSTIMEKLSYFIKFIPNWFPELSGFNGKVHGMIQVQKYLNSLIEEHKRSKVADQPRDIIDAYLDEVDKTSDPKSAFFAAHNNITFAVQDLFIAGVETTTTTLEWLLFYLAKYPDVQEKLQQEIDTVLEIKNLPSYQDRQKLPYVEAVIQEVSRIASIAPLGVIHSALEDTSFNDYVIPKDTAIVANLYAIQHDKDIWGDPDVFRPERFLDKDGNFMKSDDVLAFSCGKRSCIGEQLAKLQLFVYTVSIFQRFNVKAVGALPSEKGIFGITLAVLPFALHVSKRKLL